MPAQKLTTFPMIFIISGGTGASAGQLVRTVLAQFPDVKIPMESFPQIRHSGQLGEIVARASEVDGVIVHTLVDVALRRALIALASKHQVVEINLMGSLLDQLAQRLDQRPLGQPGLY